MVVNASIMRVDNLLNRSTVARMIMINTCIVSHSCSAVFDIASIAAITNSGDSKSIVWTMTALIPWTESFSHAILFPRTVSRDRPIICYWQGCRGPWRLASFTPILASIFSGVSDIAYIQGVKISFFSQLTSLVIVTTVLSLSRSLWSIKDIGGDLGVRKTDGCWGAGIGKSSPSNLVEGTEVL